MKTIEVYDPAMCCSTGVCGPEVDPVLVAFAADLKWVADQGVTVRRYNLGQEPQAFAANPAVVKLVGLIEVLGAAGLLLPPLLNTAVLLAPLAAIGLVLVQAVAIGVHMQMKDARSLPINIALLLLAFAAAWIGVLTLPF